MEYKPVVSLEVDRLHIYEGDSVKLSCAAAAVPELVEYSWRLGEDEIKEGRGAKEVVIVVDRSVAKIIVTQIFSYTFLTNIFIVTQIFLHS